MLQGEMMERLAKYSISQGTEEEANPQRRQTPSELTMSPSRHVRNSTVKIDKVAVMGAASGSDLLSGSNQFAWLFQTQFACAAACPEKVMGFCIKPDLVYNGFS